MTPQLTDAQIDGLDGRELDRAVANAAGHYCEPNSEWIRIESHGISELPRYHSDLGAAMALLLDQTYRTCESVLIHSHVCVSIPCVSVYASVLDLQNGKPLQTGPKSEAASVIARAFLKLMARK